MESDVWRLTRVAGKRTQSTSRRVGIWEALEPDLDTSRNEATWELLPFSTPISSVGPLHPLRAYQLHWLLL